MRFFDSLDKNLRVSCAKASLRRGTICFLTLLINAFAVAGENDSTPGSADAGSWIWELQLERVTDVTFPFLDKAISQTENVTLLLDRRGYALIEPDQTLMYEAAKQRLYTLDRDENRFSEMPLHALVWFRANETMHRNAMCHALEATQQSLVEMEPCSRFELETLFSISVPHASKLFEENSPQINKIQVDHEWHFQHDGREFVSFRPSAHDLSASYGASFRQFLAHQCDVHPEIRRQLVEFGKCPETLTFMSREGTKLTKVRYSLRNASFTERLNIFEIPPGFVAGDGDSPLEQILKKLAQTEIPGPAELQKEAEVDIDDALVKGNKIEAVLAAQRYFVITDDGIGYRRLLQRCGGMGDSEIQRILYEFGNIRKMQEAKRTLDARKSRLSYLLNYDIADMAMSEHRQDVQVQELLFDALNADVLIVGAYLDLSRLFMSEWDISSAWQCIDAAKRIAPSHSNLAPIKSMERSLEVDFPDYF